MTPKSLFVSLVRFFAIWQVFTAAMEFWDWFIRYPISDYEIVTMYVVRPAIWAAGAIALFIFAGQIGRLSYQHESS